MIDARIANKEVVVFIRANAVTRSDQASMAALCVAALPVIWLRSIEVPGCAVRHGTTATRLGNVFRIAVVGFGQATIRRRHR